ncbi:MAG: hypothetical protein FWD97_00535 [Defluviitaleaceae bacterium]|nr:hypothetical protein [Defluviitaleaceae bacterium]
MNPTTKIIPKHNITDHTASKINKLAEKFFSNPENLRKFEEWNKNLDNLSQEEGGKSRAK